MSAQDGDGLPETPLVEVRIVGLPLDVYQETAERTDELLREFALIREQDHDDGGRAVPRRLLELVAELTGTFSGFTTQQESDIRDALDRGDPSIDIVYRVPAAAKPAALELANMLDEADEFCLEGKELLTLAATRREVAFRRWFLDEFVNQIDGEEPTRWEAPPDSD